MEDVLCRSAYSVLAIQIIEMIKSFDLCQMQLLRDLCDQFGRQNMLSKLTPPKVCETSSELLTRTEGSAKKGLLGELNFEHIIQGSAYNIENISKLGKRGDFILTDNTDPTRILIEIKNYNKTIPKEEINKFYRDLRANSTMDAGIIISYNTKFTGRPQKNVSEEYFMNGVKKIPLLFIVNSNSDFILQNIDMLFALVRLTNRSDLIRDEIISSGLRTIKEHSDNLSQIRNTSGELLVDLNKHVHSINSCSLELEHSLMSTITDICRHLEVTDTITHNDVIVAYNYMINNYKISTSSSKILKLLLENIMTVYDASDNKDLVIPDSDDNKVNSPLAMSIANNKTIEKRKTTDLSSVLKSETAKLTGDETISGKDLYEAVNNEPPSTNIFTFNKNSVVISMPNRVNKTIFLRTKIELFVPMTLLEFGNYIYQKCIISEKIKYNKGMYMEITELTYDYVCDLFMSPE